MYMLLNQKPKDLNEAIIKGFKLMCFLHILQKEIDDFEKSGFKFNQLLKKKANIFKEELEKEMLFLYKSFEESSDELIFYQKINEMERKLSNANQDFKLD